MITNVCCNKVMDKQHNNAWKFSFKPNQDGQGSDCKDTPTFLSIEIPKLYSQLPSALFQQQTSKKDKVKAIYRKIQVTRTLESVNPVFPRSPLSLTSPTNHERSKEIIKKNQSAIQQYIEIKLARERSGDKMKTLDPKQLEKKVGSSSRGEEHRIKGRRNNSATPKGNHSSHNLTFLPQSPKGKSQTPTQFKNHNHFFRSQNHKRNHTTSALTILQQTPKEGNKEQLKPLVGLNSSQMYRPIQNRKKKALLTSRSSKPVKCHFHHKISDNNINSRIQALSHRMNAKTAKANSQQGFQ